jgi:RHS repeat-associated protein
VVRGPPVRPGQRLGKPDAEAGSGAHDGTPAAFDDVHEDPRRAGRADRPFVGKRSVVSLFPIPGWVGQSSLPLGITAGTDGNIYFAAELGVVQHIIGKVAPGGTITSLDVTAAASIPGTFQVAAAHDGTIWFTTHNNQIGVIDTSLTTVESFAFGRSAALAYDGSGRLSSITDTVGIVSSFGYDASGLVNTLTTPYGTTTFTYGTDTAANSRFLQTTDPLGFTERLEFMHGAPGIAASDPSVPAGMNASNVFLQYRNSFFWDKYVFPTYGTGAGKDYTKAKRWHWLHTPASQTSPLAESTKEPLENRVWNNYVGQGTSYFEGTSGALTATGRVLDDGTTQLTKYTRNPIGKPLTVTDPVGRTAKNIYDLNNIDLLQVQQQTSTGNTPTFATLASFTYNTQHEPLTYTDTAGQVWTYGYNAAGQLTSVTDPQTHVTTYNYDAQGRLTTVVNANNATALTLNYLPNCDTSNPGHVNCDLPQSVTDSEGRTVGYTRDALDRVTVTAYPDGSTDTDVYINLDRTSSTDRLGRMTAYTFDADRRLTGVTDPLTHVVSYDYFANGALNTLTDQNGNVTTWTIDIQSRPATKTYADGKGMAYIYENTTSRLKNIADALSQVKTLGYFKDDSLATIKYTGALNPTPDVSFTYDPFFLRRTGMTDGNGSTSWTYVPVGTLGALAMLTEDGAFDNDAVTYGYDELGRVNSLAVGDTAPETWGFDPIGRRTSHVTGLGSFTYGFLGQTSEPVSRALAGTSITTAWSYDTNTNDRRLTGIANSSGARSFTLGYQVFGRTAAQDPYDIATIIQTAGTLPAQSFCYQYDGADRLTNVGTFSLVGGAAGGSGSGGGVTGTGTGGSGGAAGAGGHACAGADSGDDHEGGDEGNHGKKRDSGKGQGTNDDPDKDNCKDGNNGKGNDKKNCGTGGASGSGGHSGPGGAGGTGGAMGGPPVPTCTGSLFSYALDPADNLTTFTSATGTSNPTYNNLNQQVTNGSQSVAYDLNGNTTSDGPRTYRWDAENRLVEIDTATGMETIRYDGLGRRVEVTFTPLTGTAAVTRFTWCRTSICQKRDGADTTLTRYFPEGQHNTEVGQRWVMTTDQLSSIRDVLDASSGTVIGSMDYSPYGQLKSVSGNALPDFLYAGLFLDSNSGLYLSESRPFDPASGRWLRRDDIQELGARLVRFGAPDYDAAAGHWRSKDPLGFAAGDTNLYAYVGGNPVNQTDPAGTDPAPYEFPPPGPFENNPPAGWRGPRPQSTPGQDNQCGASAPGSPDVCRVLATLVFLACVGKPALPNAASATSPTSVGNVIWCIGRAANFYRRCAGNAPVPGPPN